MYCESSGHVTTEHDDDTWRDYKRLRSWPWNLWGSMCRQPCDRHVAWLTMLPTGNHVLRVQHPRDRWRHVTPKRHGNDPEIFGAPYLGNRTRWTFDLNWPPTGNNSLCRDSNDRWRHVTQKDNIYLSNISKTVRDRRLVGLELAARWT